MKLKIFFCIALLFLEIYSKNLCLHRATIRNFKAIIRNLSIVIVTASIGGHVSRGEDNTECVSSSNPSITTVSCRKLGLVDGRLRGCAANENCFSSSAKAATKYIPPWTFEFSDKDAYIAWSHLKEVITSSGLKVLKSTDEYILAAEKGSDVPKQPVGSSLFYEFLLRPEDKLVLERGLVDKTIFVYPLQQPVSDFGALLNRLNGIKEKVGWLTVGEL